MKWISGILWVAAALTGCSQTIDFRIPENEVLKMSITNSGVPVTECVIKPGSVMHVLLSAWIEQNSENWKATPASYVPGIMVSGNEFAMNILGEGVIINYDGGQYSHSIKPNALERMQCGESA